MLSSSSKSCASLAFIVAVFFGAACSSSEGVTTGDGTDAAAGDAGNTNDARANDAAPSDGSLLDSGLGDSGLGDAGLPDARNPAGLGPAPVAIGSPADLSTPGSYVLLAKTGITNVTGSSITGGEVGLSPAAASFITGFTLIADSTDVFSTSSSVVPPGRVYASDYAPPTPSNLTSAVLGMQSAYADAAGRTNPDYLNLGSGDIGGRTLAAGLYTWNSGVTIPDDVTLTGGASDVWIFQIANDLDVSASKNVILSGGAQAQNIFWQIAGYLTVHADAHFEGIVLSQTAITLQTNASMNGRALAQTLVALDDNAVTAP